jgi:TolB-like protein/DNA-binding winged helix-turn-helix (wHTH) protein/Tfp pilus assembly protein PilF
MSENGSNPTRLRFGIFEVDLEARELRKSGIKIRLQPQPFEILALLASRPGQVVSREEIQQKLWSGGTFVDFDRSLNAGVKRLRVALSDDADTPRYVETIPRRGYRMIAPVVPVSTTAPAPIQPALEPRRLSVRQMAFAISALLVLGLTSYFVARRAGSSHPSRVLLAIMPFENFAPGVEAYFSDGLTEELIADMGQLNPSSLGVIARTSAMHYKGTHQTVATIGSDLGVDYVLEGSVRREANRLRITVQLIRVSDQTHVWAHSYDRDSSNALALETELAQAIAKEVRINVPDPDAIRARSAKRHPSNAEAQKLYLQGRFYWNKRYNESLKLSQSSFQKAIQIDPRYALAYSGLADADFVLAVSGTMPAAEVMPAARAAALKATQLDPELAEAHVSLAQILSNYDWNWPEAEREYKRGIELNANYSTGHLWYGTFLMDMGRSAEAISEMRQAQEVDPLSSIAGTFLARAYYYGREYDKAIAQYRAVLQTDPGFPIASSFLVHAYEQTGQFDDAIAECRRAIPLAGGEMNAAAQFTDALARAFKSRGPAGYWQARLESAGNASSLDRAALHARLGHTDQALKELNKAYAEHDIWLVPLKVDPQWDMIRSDSRFKTLLQQVGLDQHAEGARN